MTFFTLTTTDHYSSHQMLKVWSGWIKILSLNHIQAYVN